MTIGPGMEQLCEKLIEVKFPLSDAHAIEVFARQGDWHTTAYADKVATIEAWEIDESHFPALMENLPSAEIKQVDSVDYIKDPTLRESADLVVIDNPQNTFGPNDDYCEHFDVVDYALDLLRPGGVVIFNVNIEPFNYDMFPKWKTRREDFYQRSSADKFSVEELLDFYERRFSELGRRVSDKFSTIRTGYLHYLAYRFD